MRARVRCVRLSVTKRTTHLIIFLAKTGSYCADACMCNPIFVVSIFFLSLFAAFVCLAAACLCFTAVRLARCGSGRVSVAAASVLCNYANGLINVNWVWVYVRSALTCDWRRCASRTGENWFKRRHWCAKSAQAQNIHIQATSFGSKH